MTPHVSIIIPTYNGAKYISQTLQSVFDQTMTNWELIVVDDGSTDSSVAVAREIAGCDRRVRIISQKNTGIAGARNRGFAESNSLSKYVLFLDHDDILEPYALELLSGEFERTPDASMVYGLVRFIDNHGYGVHPKQRNYYFFECLEARGRRLDKTYTVADDPGFETWICQNIIMSPGAVLILRDALGKIGVFDQEVAPCDDWDLWLRLSLVGRTHRVPQFVLAYREHATNTSSNTEVMIRARWAVLAKWTSLCLDDIQRTSATTILKHYQLIQEESCPTVERSLSTVRAALAARGRYIKRVYRWADRDPLLLDICMGDVDLHDLIMSAANGAVPAGSKQEPHILTDSERSQAAHVYRRLLRMQSSLDFARVRMNARQFQYATVGQLLRVKRQFSWYKGIFTGTVNCLASLGKLALAQARPLSIPAGTRAQSVHE